MNIMHVPTDERLKEATNEVDAFLLSLLNKFGPSILVATVSTRVAMTCKAIGVSQGQYALQMVLAWKTAEEVAQQAQQRAEKKEGES